MATFLCLALALLAPSVFAEGVESTEAQQLAADDECADQQCSLNALQVRTAAKAEEVSELSQNASQKVHTAAEGPEQYMLLRNKLTGQCLTVAKHENGKPDLMVMDSCRYPRSDRQKVRVEPANNWMLFGDRIHFSGGRQNKCVRRNGAGFKVLAADRDSCKTEKWQFQSKNGVDGWLSSISGGPKVCIGIEGTHTPRGVLAGYGPCSFHRPDQVWNIVHKV
eukprot:TRINITY_DN1784_c0_g1_i1.p1 TRINITY_DN1784_c0_g1~~TRINITY_DN1784_c0_g1_i1.p1  ORF type:complete len:222 (-),score=39.10 TRINITY_DN1784_c0_g1_i1:226-891(-)